MPLIIQIHPQLLSSLPVVLELCSPEADRALIYGDEVESYDPDMLEVLQGELGQYQSAEMQLLRQLLNAAREKGALAIEDDIFIPMVRGLTVIRFRLRDKYFADIPDEALQTGQIKLADPKQVVALVWFQLFAELQGAICSHLMGE